MQLLKDRIIKDGKAIGDDILKVDSFLNHQIDISLLDAVGEEFAKRFRDEKVNKILTVEASGIPIACSAARFLGNIPVVFAKKNAPSTMTEDFFISEIKSFTKGNMTKIIVSKKYLSSNDNVLLIDDFLASGQAAIGLLDICAQAGAKVSGLGAVIEKKYQGGSDLLRAKGIRVESLAVITSIHDGKIEFLQ